MWIADLSACAHAISCPLPSHSFPTHCTGCPTKCTWIVQQAKVHAHTLAALSSFITRSIGCCMAAAAGPTRCSSASISVIRKQSECRLAWSEEVAPPPGPIFRHLSPPQMPVDRQCAHTPVWHAHVHASQAPEHQHCLCSPDALDEHCYYYILSNGSSSC